MHVANCKNILIRIQFKNRRVLFPIARCAGRAGGTANDRKRKNDDKSSQGRSRFHAKIFLLAMMISSPMSASR